VQIVTMASRRRRGNLTLPKSDAITAMKRGIFSQIAPSQRRRKQI
jgi:hypothetical protein